MDANPIPAIHRLLKREYATHQAPIIELIKAQGADPFHILVATALSARTKDETTAAACRRLFAVIQTPADLQTLPTAKLEQLIYPVGFYRTKSRHLKALAATLQTEYNGQVPTDIESLCRLPGVGRKTANLVVINAFDQHGMCVDTHVHRISNRLGLIQTTTPAASELALRQTLPKRYWKTWNRHLVSFGQTICKPITPHCSQCVIRDHCQRIAVKRAH